MTPRDTIHSVITSADIRCEGVTRTFPGENLPAVDNVTFEASAGELVVLLGPSGCGKTTLLKMINRLYEVDQGRIWIGGQEIHTLPVNQLRRQIGYVIQQVGLFPHMTIRKNIAVVPNLLGWTEERIEKRTADLLEIIGLPAAYLEKYPRQLSGGEQQRIGLARALAADPAILLMDEPFAAVDAINRERLQAELLEIQRRLHKTILFVTHDVEEAFRLADKILVMNHGSLVQYGTPLEIVTRPENEFIEELIGTGNMMRRMSLLSVQSILDGRQSGYLQAVPGTAGDKVPARIQPHEDLRSALSMLLKSGADTLQVVQPSGEMLGEIGFNDLRTALAASISNGQEDRSNELPGQ